MISIQKRNNGFTIVELLIVLVVIGVLFAIVFTTYSGIQAKERNTTRQTDIKALQRQLIAFYSQNQYYPSLSDMNSAAWVNKNLPGFNAGDLQDPSGTSRTLVSTPRAKYFAYTVSNSGSSCEGKLSMTCNQYVLTATLEGGGTFIENSIN